jgi:hypothetical protein
MLLIYGDLCPFAPEQRAKLLDNVRTALKPGGSFILDVRTPRCHEKYGLSPCHLSLPVPALSER